LLMECLAEYQRQYGKVPSWEVIYQLVLDKCAAIGQDSRPAYEYFKKLQALPANDTDYVLDRVIAFCKHRALINAVKTVARQLKNGETVGSEIIPMFEEATHIGENIEDLGYIFHHSVDAVIDKIISPEFGVRTGFPQLDNIWKTGWAPGWLIALLAPPKRYKTTVALNIALNIVGPSVGGNVFYYACEISGEQAVLKGFYNITGFNEDIMFDSPEKFKQDVKKSIEQKIVGNLVIKHFPIGTASVGGQIRAHTRMLVKQLGITPHLIVIDYADTVNSSTKTGDDKAYIVQANVYKEAIAVGSEFGAAALLPDRLTAEAAEQKVPVKRVFQGAFAKGGIVDGAIVLCQTPTEYQKNIFRTFVYVNRHGPAFQYFQGSVDPASSKIDFGDSIPYNPDEEAEKPRYSSNRKNGGVPEDLTNDGAT